MRGKIQLDICSDFRESTVFANLQPNSDSAVSRCSSQVNGISLGSLIQMLKENLDLLGTVSVSTLAN